MRFSPSKKSKNGNGTPLFSRVACTCPLSLRNGMRQRCRGASAQERAPADAAAAAAADALPSLDAIYLRRVPTYKNIPRQARRPFAECLARAAVAVVLKNSVDAWTELLMCPKVLLCTPPRRGKARAEKTARHRITPASLLLMGAAAAMISKKASSSRAATRSDDPHDVSPTLGYPMGGAAWKTDIP